ncbi:BnaA09g50810D [Brassica napus]|uniref:BnaA09g50810D protein n=1 Tax=Brassica napus TaxID=3708 RepID=A0A078H1I6_BRANA|nr:BnaA09g50810D [Brassica napus]
MVKATRLLHLKDKEKLSLKLPFQCLNPNLHHLLYLVRPLARPLRFQHHLVHHLLQLRDLDVADHQDEVKVVHQSEDSHRSLGELVFTHVLSQIEYLM